MRPLLIAIAVVAGVAVANAARASRRDDEAAIQAVFQAFRNDWNTSGFPGLETLLTQDADFVVVTGKWLKGRDVIVAYHRDLLRTFYAGSHLSVEEVTVRFTDDRHAVVHLATAVQYTAEDGQQVRRPSLATATLEKIKGTWLIDTFHNTITGGPGYMFGAPPNLPIAK